MRWGSIGICRRIRRPTRWSRSPSKQHRRPFRLRRSLIRSIHEWRLILSRGRRRRRTNSTCLTTRTVILNLSRWAIRRRFGRWGCTSTLAWTMRSHLTCLPNAKIGTGCTSRCATLAQPPWMWNMTGSPTRAWETTNTPPRPSSLPAGVGTGSLCILSCPGPSLPIGKTAVPTFGCAYLRRTSKFVA